MDFAHKVEALLNDRRAWCQKWGELPKPSGWRLGHICGPSFFSKKMFLLKNYNNYFNKIVNIQKNESRPLKYDGTVVYRMVVAVIKKTTVFWEGATVF